MLKEKGVFLCLIILTSAGATSSVRPAAATVIVTAETIAEMIGGMTAGTDEMTVIITGLGDDVGSCFSGSFHVFIRV